MVTEHLKALNVVGLGVNQNVKRVGSLIISEECYISECPEPEA
jgi:hypothetical protein